MSNVPRPPRLFRAAVRRSKTVGCRRRLLAAIVTAIATALLQGCAAPAGADVPIPLSDLPGWYDDRQAEAWPALLRGCRKLRTQGSPWSEICADAEEMRAPTDSAARRFFEQRFSAYTARGEEPRHDALVTGYYEPLLNGSGVPDERYRYPIYGRPHTLIKIETDAAHSELGGKRTRGRHTAGRLVPFFTRREIDGPEKPLAGQEILWTDDRNTLFFLHVQGSGRVQLPDGSVIGVGYADNNGHPYVSIGRRLIDRGEIPAERVTLFSILGWLRSHPDQADALLNENPRYIFFALRDAARDGPVGSLNVPLTPQRSAAVDPGIIPLGTPLWVSTALPGAANSAYRRLVFAQDTGAAIKGPVRIDLFWGHGAQAERMAGIMKQPGSVYTLRPETARD